MSGINDALLRHIVPRLAEVSALGGSRARGKASATSDYDIGLYYGPDESLDIDLLSAVAKKMVDDPAAAVVTSVGAWGPRIVGGGWLTSEGTKVDLLYRCIQPVSAVISECRAGRVSMDCQPGHPHGFLLRDMDGRGPALPADARSSGSGCPMKTSTSPYPRSSVSRC